MNIFSLLSDRYRCFQPNLLWPGLWFLLSQLVITLLDLDIRFADTIYGLGNHSWLYRDAWVTENLIHKGGRTLTGVMLVLWLIGLAASYFNNRLAVYRRGFWYVLASALLSALIINILKQTTGMDCPWDLERYGGVKIYHSLLAAIPTGQVPGRCFPAGHASAMYAWFGLFYFTCQYRPAWKFPVLTAVLLLGLIFGIAQQLRGAHFLSHDLWTAFLCWITASLLAPIFLTSTRLHTPPSS